MKEPFYLSTRFWVAVLTPVVTALLALAVEKLPFLASLSPEAVTAFLASWVAIAVTYIVARTIRNTPSR